MDQSSTSIFHKRYALQDVLGQGGMGIVYRAEDRLLRQSIALKRVTAFASHPAPTNTTPRHSSHADRIVLAREFQTLASLRHPNIISVLEYGFEDTDPFFTMEYLQGGVPITQYPAPTVPDKIGLIIQMLQALRYIHRRGLLHRDLKPANVLVANGVVKLLDFGLTVTREQATGTVGTVAYMAPETLREEPATEASDLYSVGIITYELLTGRHPYDQSSTSRLLQQILSEPPDLTLLRDLPRGLVDAITALLHKDPAKRCAKAADAIEMLRPFAAAQDVGSVREIQESYLQAARFVGREAEISQLKNAFRTSMDTLGSIWLIGGESGVGKSRLINELRIMALVEGALVLQGTAVAEGGSPYHVWHDVLEMLTLATPITPDQASILADVVPSIHQLVDFPVPDAPILNPQATQDRFIATVQALFKSLDKPVVVLLEDLHWAGSEVFMLINRLAKESMKQSLMIVGTYRDDEAPDLPSRTPSANTLRLGRLETANISALLESMLGAKGTDQRIVEFVRRETEGNTFFIVEAIRALAEESGELETIPGAALPTEILAGGMQAVLQRRLDRVPPSAQPLLQIAAVVGRDIDLAVLQAAAPSMNLDAWVGDVANAAVLEAIGKDWHFTHAKLRESLLRDMPPDRVKSLNAQVAEISERLYPDRHALLAHYWHQAGNLPKEAIQTAAAGKEALENGAYQEAIRFLERAAEMAPAAGLAAMQRGQIQSQLAQAHYALGHLGEGKLHISNALDLFGYPVGTTRGAVIRGLLGALIRQLMHRYIPGSMRQSAPREVLLEASRALQVYGEISYFTLNVPQGIFAVLQAMNLSEPAGVSPELANNAVGMAIACGLVPIHGAGEFYAKVARRTMDQLSMPAVSATVGNLIAIHYTGLGKWTQAEEVRNIARKDAGEIGDIRQWTLAAATRSIMLDYQGNFEEAARLNELVYETALRSENIQQQGWGLYSRGENLTRMGRTEEALDQLNRAMESLVNDVRVAAKVRVLPNIALNLLRQGKEAEASEFAAQAAEIALKNRPTVYSGMEGYAALTEYFIEVWQREKSPALEEKVRACLKMMAAYSRLFPVGIARATLYDGMVKAASGKQDAALKAWAVGLNSAHHYENTYDEGRLLALRGKALGDQEMLTRARTLLEACQAEYDITRLL